jgi:hypothetical protein
MKKTTGIIALAAASALVLSGCAADGTNDAADPVEDNGGTVSEDTNGNDNGGSENVEEPAPETLPAEAWRVAPGEYVYGYNLTDNFDSMGGWLASGTMIVGADGSCEYDMQVLSTSADITEGEPIVPEATLAKTAEISDALAYAPEDLDEQTFTVPEARSVFSLENTQWDDVYVDPYIGIGMNSIGDYQGPCFMLSFADMLENHPNQDLVGETETGGYVFNEEKLTEYEEARIAETAAAMFSTQENADELAAAWADAQPRFAPVLSDPDQVILTQGQAREGTDELVINITNVTAAGGMGTYTLEALPEDNEFPYQVFLPEIDEVFTLGDYGQSIADELLASE